MKQIELFEKWDGKWRSLSLASFTGNPIRKEIWESMDGKEIIGKLTQDGRVTGYCAGTKELRDYYSGKTEAKVWSWAEAAAMMERSGSALVGEGWDLYDQACAELLKTFGEGCKVESIQYGEGV